MMRATDTDDVLIVQLNPIVRTEIPRRAADILDRLSEISFNASLVTELRFLAERNRLIANGELSAEKHRRTHLHMIHGDRALDGLPPSTKLLADRGFLLKLRDQGRAAADSWLTAHADKLGQRSSFNYRRLVAQLTQESDEAPDPAQLRAED
jgi:NTE family protein